MCLSSLGLCSSHMRQHSPAEDAPLIGGDGCPAGAEAGGEGCGEDLKPPHPYDKTDKRPLTYSMLPVLVPLAAFRIIVLLRARSRPRRLLPGGRRLSFLLRPCYSIIARVVLFVLAAGPAFSPSRASQPRTAAGRRRISGSSSLLLRVLGSTPPGALEPHTASPLPPRCSGSPTARGAASLAFAAFAPPSPSGQAHRLAPSEKAARPAAPASDLSPSPTPNASCPNQVPLLARRCLKGVCSAISNADADARRRQRVARRRARVLSRERCARAPAPPHRPIHRCLILQSHPFPPPYPAPQRHPIGPHRSQAPTSSATSAHAIQQHKLYLIRRPATGRSCYYPRARRTMGAA